jgi:signal transduction histidine kinase
MRNEQHSNKPSSVPGVDELQDAFAGPSIPIEYSLLSPDHRILERRFMAFPPFGKDSQGEAIRDMGGVSIRSNVEYLEENTSRKAGPEAGRVIVEDLARQLNERIPDPACHVTVDSLKNPWMSYSNEFTAYLVELCIDLSGDPQFQFHMGREKLIPPLIQILMRPFSAGQVYKTAAYYARHYANNSYELEGLHVTDRSATLRMRLSERALRQFGPYRRACAKLWCEALKVGLAIVPEKVHNSRHATVTDRCCLVAGDPYCEWEVQWEVPAAWYSGRGLVRRFAKHVLQTDIAQGEQLIQEQMQSLEVRHDELRKAYVELQNTAVELQRRVQQLTTLHEAGLMFATLRDRDVLLRQALEIVLQTLRYDRAMITFFDAQRGVCSDARLLGVDSSLADYARSLEVPVTDPDSLEGRVFLRGEAVLVPKTDEMAYRLHPVTQELMRRIGTHSFITVPLKARQTIVGAVTVDRNRTYPLTEDDVSLMVTFVNQLAIALDNADAYQAIEGLNLTLEAKVHERTVQLEIANEQLREHDRRKNQFLSHVSHDLKTPLTSIVGFIGNMLDGLAGPLQPKQHTYLERVKANAERLSRMISDLLDLSRILFGALHIHRASMSLNDLAQETLDQLQLIADRKSVTLQLQCPHGPITVFADRDRLNQVVTNLLDNALKFTPSGGTVSLCLQQGDDDRVSIAVSDTGCGIPQSAIERLFEAFFQAHPLAAAGREGLGLGLSIVKFLVDLHGGTISVTSREQKGTTFTVHLPKNHPAKADA